jgi:phosphoglycolate phosphatase-like HAD superfamily hydrolase
MAQEDTLEGVERPASPDATPSAAVFDIDGVLADVRHRLHHVASRPKDWDAFFGAAPEDPALPEGLAAVTTAAAAGNVVIYLTGRPERCRADTLAWLAAQGLPPGDLFMRDDSDRRPARLTKVATLRRLARRFRIDVFVDDDAAVVQATRTAGFRVLHADWMGAEPPSGGQPLESGVAMATAGEASMGPGAGQAAPGIPLSEAQEVLFEIQETEGRT